MNESSQAKVLFDLDVDPGERVNLRRDAAYNDEVDGLSELLREALDRPPVFAPSLG